MDERIIALLLISLLAISAGCTGTAGTTTPSPSATVSPVTTAPADSQSCTTDADCVPAQCCHPTSCTVKTAAPSCTDIACTMVCQGPLDCGAGSCGCVNGKCSVVPASSGPATPEKAPSLTIEVSPERYSPLLSSTPGIRLIPNLTGSDVAGATFTWTASYGHFISWGPSGNFTVVDLKNPATTQEETVYWTFTDKPASTNNPVIITVIATHKGSATVLGDAQVTLTWDGDYAVSLRDIT